MDIETLQVMAEHGNGEVKYKLGLCYYRGKGVQENPKKAVYWLTKVAEKGNVEVERMLKEASCGKTIIQHSRFNNYISKLL